MVRPCLFSVLLTIDEISFFRTTYIKWPLFFVYRITLVSLTFFLTFVSIWLHISHVLLFYLSINSLFASYTIAPHLSDADAFSLLFFPLNIALYVMTSRCMIWSISYGYTSCITWRPFLRTKKNTSTIPTLNVYVNNSNSII